MEQRTVKGTQKERILEYLRNNPHLSSKQAREEMGVKNLRARMDEIRKSGVKVYTERLPGGQTTYRIDDNEQRQSPSQPMAVQQPQSISDIKEQFVEAIKQVLEEKGLILGQSASTSVGGIRQRLTQKNADIADSLSGNTEIDDKINMLDSAITRVTNRLAQQVEIVNGLSAVIKKSTENVKKMGEVTRLQDVRRNSILIDTAKQLRKELEGVGVSAQVTQDTGRDKNSRIDGLRKGNITVKNAKIVVEGTAKFDMLSPTRPVQRMSGIDKEDKPKRSSSDNGSSGKLGGLGSLAGLALGAASLYMLLDSDTREKVTDFVGEVLTGATETLVKDAIVPLAKASVSAVGDAIVNHPAMAAFGIGGTAAVGARAAGAVAKVSSKYGFSGIAGKASTASTALKIGARGAPLVGGLIDTGSRLMEGQGIARSVIGGLGSTIGSAGGMILGSVLGPVGTIVGGVAGGYVGGKIADGISNYFGFGGQSMDNSEFSSDIDGDRTPSQMDPEEAKLYTFQYLKENGFSDEQAAGILGNIMTETAGFKNFNNPDDKTASGKSMGRSAGIVQWNGPRLKDFQRIVGKDPLQATLKEQLDFMLWEMNNTHKSAMTAVKRSTTAREAALEFEDKFEKSAKHPEHMQWRVDNAEKVLKQMRGRVGGTKTNSLFGSMSVPQTPKLLQNSSTPLKEIRELSDVANSPTIIMPQTNISAPSTNISGGSSGSSSPVITVRDTHNPFIRNADKHSNYNFAR